MVVSMVSARIQFIVAETHFPIGDIEYASCQYANDRDHTCAVNAGGGYSPYDTPRTLSQAIEEKLRAEQESQRMQFVLTKERQEAERKRIEAQGISDFQNIVAKGISEQLLRWKGIEATQKLAESSNSKVVVIGAGKDGLPIILDTK